MKQDTRWIGQEVMFVGWEKKQTKKTYESQLPVIEPVSNKERLLKFIKFG